MIEIILRKDIQDYEARPLFGFTYRQVLSGVLIAASSTVIALGFSRVGITGTPMILVVLAVAGAIGFIGLGRVHGLKPEEWYRIWKEDRSWPRVATFSPVILDAASGRQKKRPRKLSARQRRAVRRDAYEAAREMELSPISKMGV